jgi:hypothetical protein
MGRRSGFGLSLGLVYKNGVFEVSLPEIYAI